MDFFNKLGDTIVNATQEAVEKGKDMTDIAKLQYEIRSKEEFCKKKFEEVGRKYFEEAKDVIPENYVDLFEEIEAANRRIAELKDQIADKKGGIACPKCGEVAAAGASFCSACGAKLNDMFEEEDEEDASAEACEQETEIETVEEEEE